MLSSLLYCSDRLCQRDALPVGQIGADICQKPGIRRAERGGTLISERRLARLKVRAFIGMGAHASSPCPDNSASPPVSRRPCDYVCCRVCQSVTLNAAWLRC
ncbi:hypothetical protein AAFF_G00358920 [Aldrovandia affinis]|uniref:Uncharacterized protein n=1 Tax=Aldrovandia affinis TaxID=143900 RepID=A0AAD7SI07_9TELE|nr:hypothetical protein AAFF_G00358920 [Aldrovandia affinis]